MKTFLLTVLHVAVMAATLWGPGGVRAVIAENLELKQQLIVLRRAQMVVPLDGTHRQIVCWMRSRCIDVGSCIVEQPPVGLTIERGDLRFVYGASVMRDNEFAVTLLTDLIRLEIPPKTWRTS